MIAVADTLARFSTIVILLVGVLTIVGMVWKTVKAAMRAINAQLNATRENTKAIIKIDQRIQRLESRWPPAAR